MSHLVYRWRAVPSEPEKEERQIILPPFGPSQNATATTTATTTTTTTTQPPPEEVPTTAEKPRQQEVRYSIHVLHSATAAMPRPPTLNISSVGSVAAGGTEEAFRLDFHCSGMQQGASDFLVQVRKRQTWSQRGKAQFCEWKI